MSNRRKVARAIVVFEGQALLLVRADHDDVRPGDYDLPGGGIDDTDASVEEGVIREIYEETGINTSADNLTEIIEPGVAWEGQDFERHVFLCRVSTTDVRIDPNEHKGFLWMPIDQVARLFKHPVYTRALEYVIREQLI